MAQFSFLKKKLEDLFCPELKVRFYAEVIRMRGRCCSESMPRYYLTLHSEVIWDFPRHFEEVRNTHFTHYLRRPHQISELVKDYVNTPVKELLVKEFENNKCWSYSGNYIPLGLIELFLACDRRLGKERLLAWAKQIEIPTVHEILQRRFNQGEAKVEVTRITAKGCWLRIFPKDYYLSFDRYPHFLGASDEEIKQVTIIGNTLEWEALDMHIGIESIERDKPNTHLGFTKKQLERLKKYNDAQIANGGKPWLSDRLLDFEHWIQLTQPAETGQKNKNENRNVPQ